MIRILFTVSLLLFSFNALANFQSSMLKAKTAKVADAQPWTLADWLSEKRKISLMDQWLALHQSGHWFDLGLSAAGMQYQLKSTPAGQPTVGTAQTGENFQADLHLAFFNLYAEYQKTNEKQEAEGGAAGLRLLGNSARTTSLLARYGIEQTNNLLTQEHTQNPFIEGQAQLYIISVLGLVGDYRYYFPATSNLDNRWQGHKWSAGVFFEFLLFRFFANYYDQPLTETTTSGSQNQWDRSGFEGGVKLWF